MQLANFDACLQENLVNFFFYVTRIRKPVLRTTAVQANGSLTEFKYNAYITKACKLPLLLKDQKWPTIHQTLGMLMISY